MLAATTGAMYAMIPFLKVDLWIHREKEIQAKNPFERQDPNGIAHTQNTHALDWIPSPNQEPPTVNIGRCWTHDPIKRQLS